MFPPVFGQVDRVGGTRGLVISLLAVPLLANLVDLTATASLGSVVALVIFWVTSIGHTGCERRPGPRPGCSPPASR